MGACPLSKKKCPFNHHKAKWEKKYGKSAGDPNAKAKAKAKAKSKGKGKGKKGGAADSVVEDGGAADEDAGNDGWGAGMSLWSRDAGPMIVVYDDKPTVMKKVYDALVDMDVYVPRPGSASASAPPAAEP